MASASCSPWLVCLDQAKASSASFKNEVKNRLLEDAMDLGALAFTMGMGKGMVGNSFSLCQNTA